MNTIYFYADAETREILQSTQQKVILLGGDLGNSNFGDILQLKGTVNFYKNEKSYLPIPIFNIDHIDHIDYIDLMKKRFQIEGLIFVSTILFDFKDTQLPLQPINRIINCDLFHLYGGGFLNTMWGDYMLSLIESTLKTFQISHYIMSGQQIEKAYAENVQKHIEYYKPMLVGVRDYTSLENMTSLKLNCTFSFDDASEELLKLASKIPVKKTKKSLGHINLSSYTNSHMYKQNIINNFEQLKKKYPLNDMVIFNAFNDRSHVVNDSLSALIEIENAFPYKSYFVVDGGALAYNGDVDHITLLAAEIALSSSYHTTLLMHLSGTPCWLVSSNHFYDQKSLALDINQTLTDFLENPQVPDYHEKLNARLIWNNLLGQTISCIKVSQTIVNIQCNMQNAKQKFRFKTNGIAEKDMWIKELQEGKDWLENQYYSLLDIIKEKDQFINTLQQSDEAHSKELHKIKKSFGVKFLQKIKLIP